MAAIAPPVVAPVAPAPGNDIVRQQLTDLRKAYISNLHPLHNLRYFAIALLVASTAMLILGSLPVALLGTVCLFTSCKTYERKLSDYEAEENRTNLLVLNRLAIPGFFEFCRQDARSLLSPDQIEIAYRRFQEEPRPL
jgi:hypothetical protein